MLTEQEQIDIGSLLSHPGFQLILSFLQKREDDRLDLVESSTKNEDMIRFVDEWRSYRQIRREMEAFVQNVLEQSTLGTPRQTFEEELIQEIERREFLFEDSDSLE